MIKNESKSGSSGDNRQGSSGKLRDKDIVPYKKESFTGKNYTA